MKIQPKVDPRRQDGLSSLWGRDAVNAKRTRECVAMPGLRKQEILTPADILDPVRAFFGGVIRFDPCGSRQQTIAEQTYYIEDDGLSVTWPDDTFANPPYAKLKDWLEHLREHAGRTCFLGPVRSQRPWWRETAKVSTVFYLRTIKFVGYDQGFPGPLCLMFNQDSPEEVTAAFPEKLGCVL